MAEVREKQVNTSEANVSLVTTAETVIISSGPVKVPAQTCLVHVVAWCQLTTGAGATSVTPRIRRGTDTSGTQVGEANNIALSATAGNNEARTIAVIERRSNEESVEYSLTLQQVGATGNALALQAAIAVEILSG